ncbi:hypothetical protein ACVWYO_000579 [Sphingomonas sp. UYP23]
MAFRSPNIGCSDGAIRPVRAARRSGPAPVTHLNPVLEFETRSFVLLPQNAATVLLREFGHAVGSFVAHRFEIMNALDRLLTGH